MLWTSGWERFHKPRRGTSALCDITGRYFRHQCAFRYAERSKEVKDELFRIGGKFSGGNLGTISALLNKVQTHKSPPPSPPRPSKSFMGACSMRTKADLRFPPPCHHHPLHHLPPPPSLPPSRRQYSSITPSLLPPPPSPPPPLHLHLLRDSDSTCICLWPIYCL